MTEDLFVSLGDIVRETLARQWRWILAGGLLAIVLGGISILAPLVTSVAVSVLVGWLLILGSGLLLASALRERDFWPTAWRATLAAFWIVAGVWMVIEPRSGTIGLTAVLVAWFWADGAVRMVGAVLYPWLPDRLWIAFGGVLSIILGALIWADFPSSADWAIGLLVGVNLLFYGANLVALGLVGRRLAHGERARLTPRPA
jgi:uncharacterized membrane protein HdeD (DUF308 family)